VSWEPGSNGRDSGRESGRRDPRDPREGDKGGDKEGACSGRYSVTERGRRECVAASVLADGRPRPGYSREAERAGAGRAGGRERQLASTLEEFWEPMASFTLSLTVRTTLAYLTLLPFHPLPLWTSPKSLLVQVASTVEEFWGPTASFTLSLAMRTTLAYLTRLLHPSPLWTSPKSSLLVKSAITLVLVAITLEEFWDPMASFTLSLTVTVRTTLASFILATPNLPTRFLAACQGPGPLRYLLTSTSFEILKGIVQ